MQIMLKKTWVFQEILNWKLINQNASQWRTTINTVTFAQDMLNPQTWQTLHAVIHAVLYEPLIGCFKYKIKFPYLFFFQCNQKLKHCNYPSGCASYLQRTDYVIRCVCMFWDTAHTAAAVQKHTFFSWDILVIKLDHVHLWHLSLVFRLY